MKMSNTIIKVLDRFQFRKAVSPKDQKKIYRANKRILKNIFKDQMRGSLLLKPVITAYYFFNNLGISLSLRGSRRVVGFSLTALLLLLVMTLVIPINNYLSKDLLKTKVISSRGIVDIVSGELAPGQISKTDFITKGSLIKTGDKSFYEFTIGKHLEIHILPHSQVRIISLTTERTTHLFLREGTVYSKWKKLKNPVRYMIETPNALIKVTGTEFSISYRRGKTIAIVKTGNVTVEQLDPGSRKVLSKEQAGKGRMALIEKSIKVRNAQEDQLEKLDLLTFPDPEKKSTGNKKAGPDILEKLKKQYHMIHVVTLYNGKVIKGVILSRGEKMKILTPRGIVFVKQDNVMTTETIR